LCAGHDERWEAQSLVACRFIDSRVSLSQYTSFFARHPNRKTQVSQAVSELRALLYDKQEAHACGGQQPSSSDHGLRRPQMRSKWPNPTTQASSTLYASRLGRTPLKVVRRPFILPLPPPRILRGPFCSLLTSLESTSDHLTRHHLSGMVDCAGHGPRRRGFFQSLRLHLTNPGTNSSNLMSDRQLV